MFQQVTVIGNLGKDPEEIGSGDPMARFSIAATERWKNRDGEKQEHTEWFNCTAFGKTADIALRYLNKGNLVTVVGKMRTTKKDDKFYTNLIVDRLVLMPNEDRGGDREERRPAREERRPAREERRPAREERRPAREEKRAPQDDAFDDDIPF